MAKGVNKIKLAKGTYVKGSYNPKRSITLLADTLVEFNVGEWIPGTTKEDVKKGITWIWQDHDRKVIVSQFHTESDGNAKVKISKKLSGTYYYYLEASLGGKRDPNLVGLYINAYSHPRIVSSKWCTTNDGSDQRSKQFKYGNLIYLGLETEGLNGSKSLIVEVYKLVKGGGGTSDDKLVATYSSVQVNDGEVNLKMGNTSTWFIHAKKDVEEFYIKVKNSKGQYISDGKDTIHARFLKLKKVQTTKAVEPSTNNTAVKTGESSVSAVHYEHCTFDSITVIDNKKSKILFDKGKKYTSKTPRDLLVKTNGYSANTIIYETIGRSTKQDLKIDLVGYEKKGCKDNHAKLITAKLNNSNIKSLNGDSISIPIESKLEKLNPAPINYIWPNFNNPNVYSIFFNSCAYYSNINHATILVSVYPDIKWTLEFKWNHKQSFAYTYGNKMHPFSIKNGKKKAIGSAFDAELAHEFGEMDQSFELSLEAEWDNKSRKVELSSEFSEKIAKTLEAFIKIKKVADSITNSPVNGGKFSFEVKAPVVAVSLQWFLEKVDDNINQVGTSIKFGIETKPLIEADIKIDLWQIVTEYGANAICPGAGKVINFISKYLEGNIGVKFEVIFDGSINVSGEISGNTINPKNTEGELSVKGKIQVTLELKAWAKADYGIAGFDGSAKANANTYLSAGIKTEIAKDGVVGYPELEFGGIKAKYVIVASVKFGIFKETFEDNGEYIIVKKCPVEFKKAYLLGPY